MMKRTTELKVDDVVVVQNDSFEVWTVPVRTGPSGRWSFMARDLKTRTLELQTAQPNWLWDVTSFT